MTYKINLTFTALATFAHVTDLTVVSLTGTVGVCLPCFDFRQRGAPHEIQPHSLSLILTERTAGYKAKLKRRPKVVIFRDGCHTH